MFEAFIGIVDFLVGAYGYLVCDKAQNLSTHCELTLARHLRDSVECVVAARRRVY